MIVSSRLQLYPRPYVTLVLFTVCLMMVLSFPAAVNSIDLVTAIMDVAKKNISSVVHIEVTERREVPNPLLPFEENPFFQQFFDNPKIPKKLQQEVRGIGSGMILDTRGHILTNYHVAGGATKIVVLLSNGRRYPATVVGSDPKTDLAVIRIDAKGEVLQPVTFGDSDKIEVGEWVVAIGQSLGLAGTVTQGIISAKHRRGLLDPTSYQDFLQTDAPINPGNSGGPLLNLRGEVIGVNTAIASKSGGSEGIGFAVPSNIAIHVGKILIAHGKIERSWLGVSVENISAEKAKSLGLIQAKGALVRDVPKGGPADRAGIRNGDVIIAYQGKEISDAADLQNMVTMTPVGRDVKITILRGGKRHDVTAKTATMKDQAKVLMSSAAERLGASFRSLTAGETQKYGLEEKQGVVVSQVESQGPLDKAGFEAGDIILGVNGQPVNLESFTELVAMFPPHQKITLLAADPKKDAVGTVDVTVR